MVLDVSDLPGRRGGSVQLSHLAVVSWASHACGPAVQCSAAGLVVALLSLHTHGRRMHTLPHPCPQLFTNSAAALPAEVDEQGRLKEQPRARLGLKQAWQQRMEATAARRAAQRQQQQ